MYRPVQSSLIKQHQFFNHVTGLFCTRQLISQWLNPVQTSVLSLHLYRHVITLRRLIYVNPTQAGLNMNTSHHETSDRLTSFISAN